MYELHDVQTQTRKGFVRRHLFVIVITIIGIVVVGIVVGVLIVKVALHGGEKGDQLGFQLVTMTDVTGQVHTTFVPPVGLSVFLSSLCKKLTSIFILTSSKPLKLERA
jgi:hypothetical protein